MTGTNAPAAFGAADWPQDGDIARAALIAIQNALAPDARDKAAEALASIEARRVPRADAGPLDLGALAALMRDGVAPLGPVLDGLASARLVDHFRALPCYGGHVPRQSDGVARPVEAARTLGPYGSYRLDQILSAPGVLALALHPARLALADAYLGCLPTIYSIHAWWTFAGAPGRGLTHGYHRDLDDFRFLSLFVYLTDVGPEDGPVVYLRGTHRADIVEGALAAFNARGTFAPVGMAELFPPFGGTGYLPERPAGEASPYDMIFDGRGGILTGPAGTGFVADTFGLHRGRPPATRDRLCLWIRYGLGPNFAHDADGTQALDRSLLPPDIQASAPADGPLAWALRLLVRPA